MNSTHTKRPVRARSGLRPAPVRKEPAPRVPGDASSKAPGKGRDGRSTHDKDGNAEAARELTDKSKKP